MDRRTFTHTAAAALVTIGLAARAQSGRIYRVGFLGSGAANVTPPPGFLGAGADAIMPPATYFDLFKKALRHLGYFEGQNVIFDLRNSEGKNERLPSLAAEIVASRPDVIVASTTPAAKALKEATATIPIVMTFVSDPVGAGLVASLAHPGGNVTGVTDFGVDLAANTLEVTRALVRESPAPPY